MSDGAVHKGFILWLPAFIQVPGPQLPTGVRCPPHPGLSWALCPLRPSFPGGKIAQYKKLEYKHTLVCSSLTTSQLRDAGQVTSPLGAFLPSSKSTSLLGSA